MLLSILNNHITRYLLEVALPLIVTFIFSWLVGLERQNIGKSAGISAHVLVSIAACAIAILQVYINDKNDRSDGQRIIAQVVTGLGFLGAGVIIKSNKTVKGLTTAATIWSTAMMGIVIGMGYWALGVSLGVFIVAFMYLRDAFRHINPFKSHREIEEIHEENSSKEIDQ